MILACVDDLMFSSKIRAAAGHAGVEVVFARSRDAALASLRATPAALVILDLNSRGTDPLGILGAIRADSALAGIRAVGFVSHVDAATIDAARQAGIDDVLARSAFASQLPQLLASARQPDAG